MEFKRPIYNFSADKNNLLKQERNVSFEEVIAALDNHQLLNVIDHPNQGKYNHQKIYVVQINEYVYLVPFVKENENSVFLKTIIPSRKAKKQYTTRGNTNETKK